MSYIEAWAEEYLQNINAAREKGRVEYERTGKISDASTHYSPVIIQTWLEELANAIIKDKQS